MSVKQVLFRLSYILAMIGGLVTVAGAWLLIQPTEGANIGAGIVLIAGTALMGFALITWVVALVAGLRG